MKHLLILALVLCSSAVVLASPTLDGNWALSERVCTDGSLPTDALGANGGAMKLNLNQGKLTETFTVNGCTYTGSAPYHFAGLVFNVGDGYFTSSCSSDSSTFTASTVLFHSSPDELAIVSAGYGEGGSCKQGQGMMMIFKRVP